MLDDLIGTFLGELVGSWAVLLDPTLNSFS